eukprot:TRINITY_DN7120_c0_g1_i1.p1 TRINITY_DN7120_c0_g1~~TRINITY_DN7120_c0_g1_i1.p1  ORF type:complete len:323 (+),score=82.00 TRINITY_DN7120_c0_g1_i1:608-1576(+)
MQHTRLLPSFQSFRNQTCRLAFQFRPRNGRFVHTNMNPLVSTAWLAEQLGQPNLKVLDATWALGKNLQPEFSIARIPGAVYFGIDAVADRTTSLPHMLPTPADFEQHMHRLGVSDGNEIVVYDRSGQFVASARVWWTFRVFGKDIRVLDGGLAKWIKEGRAVDSGPVPEQASSNAKFTARFRPELVADLPYMRRAVEAKTQIADARPRGRFIGADPEPRAGLRGGHMPNSSSIPFGTVLAKSHPEDTFSTIAPSEDLAAIFAHRQIGPGADVAFTCGSGVTASVLALAYHIVHDGKAPYRVYDGSWSEWGQESLDTPVVKGE